MTTPVTVFDYEELTLRDNVEAYRRWQLRPRLLIDVETCTTAARATCSCCCRRRFSRRPSFRLT